MCTRFCISLVPTQLSGAVSKRPATFQFQCADIFYQSANISRTSVNINMFRIYFQIDDIVHLYVINLCTTSSHYTIMRRILQMLQSDCMAQLSQTISHYSVAGNNPHNGNFVSLLQYFGKDLEILMALLISAFATRPSRKIRLNMSIQK